jgi:hypothetical protein
VGWVGEGGSGDLSAPPLPLLSPLSSFSSPPRLLSGLLVSSGPVSSDNSPVIHLRLSKVGDASQDEYKRQRQLLRRIADFVFDRHDILVSVPIYSCLERCGRRIARGAWSGFRDLGVGV